MQMASTPRLNALPEELITELATSCDALSALRLSATCRRVHGAVYNTLTFRQILEKSQKYRWNRESLQTGCIQALANKKGAKNKSKKVSVWARYALADQMAWQLAQKADHLEAPQNFLRWLPELCVVKHPFIYEQCWVRNLGDDADRALNHIFCQAVATLAAEQSLPQLSNATNSLESRPLHLGIETKDFLRALCTTATILRTAQHTRQPAWPHDMATNVRDISIPTALQLPTMPDPNLPFSSSGAFEDWYEHCNESIFTTANYFTSGTWVGYYTHFDIASHQNDPPMVNIKFRRTPTIPGRPDELSIAAQNCLDGVGPFVLMGGFTHAEMDENDQTSGDVELTMLKQYTNGPTSWMWDLRVTPFGLVGFWGAEPWDGRHVQTGIERLGTVWLWKEEWTAGRRA